MLSETMGITEAKLQLRFIIKNIAETMSIAQAGIFQDIFQSGVFQIFPQDFIKVRGRLKNVAETVSILTT